MSDLEPKAEGASETVTFGSWLKNQRLAKKVALEEIAAVTKIHIQQLRSLEDGWNGPMPAATFIRGFIVSYARHLNLNEVEVLDQFRAHAGEFKPRDAAVKSTPPQTYSSNSGKPLRFGSYSERKDQLQISHWVSTKRALYALLVLLGLGLLVLLMRLGKHSSDEAPAAATSSTEEMNPQPNQTKIVDKNMSEPGALFSGTPPYDFTLVSAADCWVNLKVDENQLESFKLGAGQTRKIVFNRKVKVTLSNPSLVKFLIGDVRYKPTSPAGSADTLTFPDQISKLVVEKPRAPVAMPAAAPVQGPQPANANP